MRKMLILAAAMAAFSAVPTKAQVSLDMSLITCKQYMESPPERKELIGNWMRGYFSATKNLDHRGHALREAQQCQGSWLLQVSQERDPLQGRRENAR